MKVRNMQSNRSGRDVPNQFIISDNHGETFQSYRTTIARRSGGKITLDRNAYDYSRTTSKYLGQFLGEPMSEIRKKIKSGEYKLADLN